MAHERKLTKEEVNEKLSQALKARIPNAGESKELSGDELAAVTGGVGAWAFESDGEVWSAVCNKSETTNAMLEDCLVYEKACPYASPGASSCFDCHHLYIGNLGVAVE